MKNHFRWISLVILLPAYLKGQDKLVGSLDAYMNAQSKVNGFSGTVLVGHGSRILYRNSFGKADIEWNTVNTNYTRYRIGSLTKQFTAACILQLEEQGKLSLTDKLSKYIDDYPSGDSVSLHMLLNHTSGIRDYTEMADDGTHADVVPFTPLEIINTFKKLPFLFAPGSDWAYSNSNYFLLGYIIEKVSGLKFGTYLQQLAADAKLQNTGLDREDSILMLRAKGYQNAGGRQIKAPYYILESPFSAGGMYSTVTDLHKWIGSLFHYQILNAISVKKMVSPNFAGYGYGMWIDTIYNQKRAWHNGGIPGFASYLSYFPDKEYSVVVLSNNESNSVAIGNALEAILSGKTVIYPYLHKEVVIDSNLLKQYIGRYLTKNVIEIVARGKKLYRKGNGSDDIELKAESINKFFYADGSDRQVKFITDKSGNVIRSYFISNGLAKEMKRLN